MPAKFSPVRILAFLTTVTAALAVIIWRDRLFISHNWGLITILMIIVALAFFYAGFERSAVSTREIGVISVLATVAALARVPFTAVPSVQPTTFLVIISGFVFGPRAGFMVGATAALVSNFFLGQGPWTPIQMLLWGLAGTTAGFLGIYVPRIGKGWMVCFSAVWGYLFGWLTNLWFWASFVQPLTPKSFLVVYAASFVFDSLHAGSNVLFYLLLGPHLIKVLKRFQRKLQPAGEVERARPHRRRFRMPDLMINERLSGGG